MSIDVDYGEGIIKLKNGLFLFLRDRSLLHSFYRGAVNRAAHYPPLTSVIPSIDGGFTWEYSEEGHEFWSTISQEFEGGFGVLPGTPLGGWAVMGAPKSRGSEAYMDYFGSKPDFPIKEEDWL